MAMDMSGKISIKRTESVILLILILFFLVISCQKKKDNPDYYVNTPIAGFSWTGNEGPAPVTVQFVNTSENADQFEWDFSDGQISTERDPQHTFHNSGIEPKNYLVVLKATDSYSGLYQRRSRVIVIQPGSGKK
jgi:PKD repeat protein